MHLVDYLPVSPGSEFYEYAQSYPAGLGNLPDDYVLSAFHYALHKASEDPPDTPGLSGDGSDLGSEDSESSDTIPPLESPLPGQLGPPSPA